MCTKRSAGIWFWSVLALLFSGIASAGLPIQHWQSANGARVYFVESHGLPLLDVSVDFDAGTRRDTAEKAGLANLTSHMLDLGANGMSEEDISRRLADVGAQLGATIDPDRAGMSLRTLSSTRERTQSLDLMTKILQQPDFPATALEREKARVIAALQEEDTQPGPIGQKAFQAALYGNHPYGLPGAGKVETVSKLQRQDLLDFFHQHYVSESAVIAIVGDVSRTEAAAIADQLSAGLPHANGTLPPLPAVTPLSQAETIRLPHPASQSHILLGVPGMSRSDPDYFPLFVGNYILGGGGFASRLTEEVREKRGLAYSVYSYFIPLAQPGPFQIGLQTKRDQATEALDITRATLRRFVADGPTADELRHAKQNLIGSFPLRLDSNRKILGYLSLIGDYRLPLDYLDQFPKNVDKVTLMDVKSAFQRHVDPKTMVTVIVGGDGKK
ncbi:peptidase M16 [Sulfurimicrobium lacus]|uniref:Peptidase M16 n=1 Tax=Sulfurimicrobium lacus TaxID=2715678 RepID=A0A6F8VIC2_9PROT|nr:pitrilysin family protein [Sulfurimicrobium lacus]BCB28515.1 peptidase M16 [Sulfurimicrobium lacus]